jgi:hypothetical protein
VILYRPCSGQPWIGTPFTRVGPWVSGTITVDSLIKGEYILAVWDHLFLSENKTGSDKLMKIYPNPAKESVNVEFVANQKTVLCIYDSLGKLVSKNRFTAGSNHFTWKKNDLPASVYYFKLSNSVGNLLENRKVIFD